MYILFFCWIKNMVLSLENCCSLLYVVSYEFCDAHFLATSPILLFGTNKKANNMSTNDDCYPGACNLIEFKQSDVLNENAGKSIVLHFRNQTRASSNDRLSQK